MPMETVKKLTDAENAAAENESAARKAAEEAVKKARSDAADMIEKAKNDAARMMADAETRAAADAGKLKAEYDARLKKETDALGAKAKGAKDKVIKIIMDELI